MQLRHVSTNLRQGLRRNMSMHAAIVLTLFVSLSLAGIGALFFKQGQLTKDAIGTELTLKVFLCPDVERNNPQCPGEVTADQKQAIISAIEDNPEVAGYEVKSQAEVLNTMRETLDDPRMFEGPDPLITADTVPEEVRVTLKDPQDYDGIVSELEFLDGVYDIQLAADLVKTAFELIDAIKYFSWAAAGVLLLAAVLLVANTIRLAALARRKEIEIMRLVGASRIFIALPFLLEAIVTGLLGALLANGALAAFMKFVIIDQVAPSVTVTPIISWAAYWFTFKWVLIAGPALTIVPTLLLTRKYLRL